MTTSSNEGVAFVVLHTGSQEAVVESISVERLNRYYQFHDVYQFSSGNDRLRALIDQSNVLAVSMTLPELLNHFYFLSLKDLRRLANVHRVAYWGRNKQQISGGLEQHQCKNVCVGYNVIVFKELFIQRQNANPIAPPPSLDIHLPVHPPILDDHHAPTETTGADLSSAPVDHLRLVTPIEKFHILQEFEEETSTGKIVMVICASCGTKQSQEQMRWTGSQEIDLSLLSNPHLPVFLRPQQYRLDIYQSAILNYKGLQYRDALGHIRLCVNCLSSLRKGKMPKYALANDLYSAYNALPENVRVSFDNSTILDRKLVCRARCNGICCKFMRDDAAHPSHSNASALSRARLGIRGNVMVVPLDTIRMNQVLPPPMSVIRDTICAVFVGSTRPSREDIFSSRYSPVLVRRSRVKTMLQFLLQMNPHYSMGSGGISFSEDNLNALMPADKDEDVPTTVEIGHIESDDAQNISMAEYAPRGDPAEVTEGDSELLLENVGYTSGESGLRNYIAMKAAALERCRRGFPFLLAGTQQGLVSDFNNPCLLTWLFPHLDPWGIIGFFHTGRRIKLTMEEQLRHLLLSDDHRFQQDPEFAFVFYNIIRKMQVSQSVRFSVSARTHRRLATDLMSVEPETLSALAKKFEQNTAYRPSSEAERKAYETMSSIAMVARQIPGSNGYKVLLQNQIRALINYQGTPTLFITVNPSDVDNPIVRLLTGEDITLEDMQRGEDMSSWQQRLLAARHPAECALFFDIIMKKFIKIILGFNQDRPKRGIFGFCDAYYGTVEAQGKGTLHCHLLVWLRGHLSPGKLREQMAASQEYRDQVFQWVESVVKCEFPVLGSHSVEESMRSQPPHLIKNSDTGDPNPGVIPAPSTHLHMDRTMDDFWVSYNAYVHQLLHRYNWHIHGPTCWKYLRKGEPRNDKSCRLRMNGIVRAHTTLDEETGALLLRRHHPRIAAYNDAVTFMLKCNTEVKFIGSGRAARDLVFYVTDYVTKPNLPVHAGMAALQYAIRKIESNIDSVGAQSSAGAVIIAVNSLMGRLEISHPQVMSYLIGGGDHYTSHKFATLNWHAICVYVESELRALTIDESLNTDRLAHDPPDLDLDVRAESVTVSSPHMDYVYRNERPQFDTLCLYDLVSFTVKSSIPSRFRAPDVQIENVPGSFSHWNHPQRATHCLQRRHEHHVPVLLGPTIPNPLTSPEVREKWAKDILVLFRPWRRIADLLDGHDSWTAAYDSYEGHLSERHRSIIQNMSAFSESVDARGQAPIRSRNDSIRNDGDSIGAEDAEHDLHQNTPNPLSFDIGSNIEFDDASSAIGDVFVYTQNDPNNGNVLDNIILQRIGSEVVSGLDKCQGFVLNTLSGDRDRNRSNAKEVAVSDIPRIVDQQIIMKEKKQRRITELSEDDTEDRQTNQSQYIRGRIRHHIQQQMVDIIRLPQSRRLGQFMTVEEEDRAIRAIVASVIQEMSLADNAEQLRAFSIVANHLIQGNPDQLLMYVSGVGGTGKSHVIRSIVKLFEALGVRDCLHLGAPTGIAAVLIGGQTLHSLAHMGVKSKTRRNIKGLIKTWKNKKYLIADEISMVGAPFLSEFSHRLREAKTGGGDGALAPFGGVNVIFMGDFGQLKPPKQPSLYAHKLTKSIDFRTASSVDGISSINGVLLWRQVSTVIDLVKNQRQSTDPVFAQFLLRLRRGQCIPPRSPSSPNDWEYLKARLLDRLDANMLRSFQDAPIIVGTKAVRDALNAKLISYHSERLHQEVGIYHARDTFNRVNVPTGLRDRLWALSGSQNKEAYGRLPLFAGMKVMITENLAFDNGIVNGTEGVIESVYYNENHEHIRTAVVAYVYIANCGIRFPGLGPDIVPIFPISTRIDIKIHISSGEPPYKGFTRKQLPLVPAYVYTDYKGQGRTLLKVIVDIVTARGQGVYVMLSRVKDINGLAILRWFPSTKVYTRLSHELREELDRLETLASHQHQ